MNLLTVPCSNETHPDQNRKAFKIYEHFEFYPKDSRKSNGITRSIKASARRIKKILKSKAPVQLDNTKYLVIRLKKKK